MADHDEVGLGVTRHDTGDARLMEVVTRNQCKPLYALGIPDARRIYATREEAIEAVQAFGRSHGYGVAIQKSRREHWAYLKCDRGGTYVNSRNLTPQTRQRQCFTRRQQCPFALIAKRIDDHWRVVTRQAAHNHGPSPCSLLPSARRMTDEQRDIVKTMSRCGATPRQILDTLRLRDPTTSLVSRDIYNARQNFRREMLGSASPAASTQSTCSTAGSATAPDEVEARRIPLPGAVSHPRILKADGSTLPHEQNHEQAMHQHRHGMMQLAQQGVMPGQAPCSALGSPWIREAAAPAAEARSQIPSPPFTSSSLSPASVAAAADSFHAALDRMFPSEDAVCASWAIPTLPSVGSVGPATQAEDGAVHNAGGYDGHASSGSSPSDDAPNRRRPAVPQIVIPWVAAAAATAAVAQAAHTSPTPVFASAAASTSSVSAGILATAVNRPPALDAQMLFPTSLSTQVGTAAAGSNSLDMRSPLDATANPATQRGGHAAESHVQRETPAAGPFDFALPASWSQPNGAAMSVSPCMLKWSRNHHSAVAAMAAAYYQSAAAAHHWPPEMHFATPVTTAAAATATSTAAMVSTAPAPLTAPASSVAPSVSDRAQASSGAHDMAPRQMAQLPGQADLFFPMQAQRTPSREVSGPAGTLLHAPMAAFHHANAPSNGVAPHASCDTAFASPMTPMTPSMFHVHRHLSTAGFAQTAATVAAMSPESLCDPKTLTQTPLSMASFSQGGIQQAGLLTKSEMLNRHYPAQSTPTPPRALEGGLQGLSPLSLDPTPASHPLSHDQSTTAAAAAAVAAFNGAAFLVTTPSVHAAPHGAFFGACPLGSLATLGDSQARNTLALGQDAASCKPQQPQPHPYPHPPLHRPSLVMGSYRSQEDVAASITGPLRHMEIGRSEAHLVAANTESYLLDSPEFLALPAASDALVMSATTQQDTSTSLQHHPAHPHHPHAHPASHAHDERLPMMAFELSHGTLLA
ncbi:hypothetical protein CXG81DRAFT_24529 [Caulochytrium protostelioides]|uniref:FAR1 domain-containing protein n=1 Tax=Caulochytrium protostelioides TaxID=1555241 RepID=A0A4P9XCD0_9FUNG|nr:hypothetical protein CXG81DRAFT_24529 [Caulochytrium protostelioides]|eukprot:RKP02830.1 hypothetical protein CXG81DRAFT_24529 [Caulochytrium protostelioides]